MEYEIFDLYKILESKDENVIRKMKYNKLSL